MRQITRDAARKGGYSIDDSCYPPLAYQGPRFSPGHSLLTYTVLEEQQASTLRAIQARFNGEWDDPDLVAYGPLSIDPMVDIIQLVNKALP